MQIITTLLQLEFCKSTDRIQVYWGSDFNLIIRVFGTDNTFDRISNIVKTRKDRTLTTKRGVRVLKRLIVLCALVASCAFCHAAEPVKWGALAWLEPYNVVWTSQSKNSGESMPISVGDIGLNVWVENDELLVYMGRAGF